MQLRDVDRDVGYEHVGRGHKLGVVTLHRSLRRVEELEQASRAPAPQWVAAGRFDLHDVGARVGQQLRAVRARDLRRAVDDPSAVEHLRILGIQGRPMTLRIECVDIGQGDATWVVMADPEGNELCVLSSSS